MEQRDVIDEKRVLAYLEGDGTLCPYCGSWHIAPVLPNGEPPYQVVHCNECGMDWTDIYKLVGIRRPDGVDVFPVDPEIVKLCKALQSIRDMVLSLPIAVTLNQTARQMAHEISEIAAGVSGTEKS